MREACSAFSLSIPSAASAGRLWIVEVVAWLPLGMPGWPSHEAGFNGVGAAERGCFSGDAASFAAGKPRADSDALLAAATVASEA